MEAIVISGKEVAKQKREQLKQQIDVLKAQGITPGLVVLLVGNDPASRSYVTAKDKASHELGMHSQLIELPETISQQELLSYIETYNNDETIHGILVQLPLPKHIDEQAVIEAISPAKDVDGFHPINVGKMVIGQDTFFPCTPYGILHLVETMNIDITGKHVVVIGRSNIVGKPVGQLFLNANATVTYCHSRTKNLAEMTRQADILIVAIGRANFVTKEHVKEGAVVIDVGVNRLETTGKLCGDVLFDEVKQVASYITPVPGGVGPMTITMLMNNTVKSAQLTLNKQSVTK